MPSHIKANGVVSGLPTTLSQHYSQPNIGSRREHSTPAADVSAKCRDVVACQPMKGGTTGFGRSNKITMPVKALPFRPSPITADRLASGPSFSPAGLSSTRLQSSAGLGRTSIDQNHKFAIGIETEFLIQGRDPNTRRSNIIAFLIYMSRLHNEKVRLPYPRMETQFEDDDWWPGQGEYKYWVLTDEADLLPTTRFDYGTWGVEMKSPKIRVSDDPDWARQVEETWAFIEKYYIVSKNPMCGTHVHISVPPTLPTGGGVRNVMSLQDIKRIAQCAIHFEPALEALVSADRRHNPFVMSNWIDNVKFVDKRVTRQVAIDMIERVPNENELINLLCPFPQERHFAWNFRALRRFGTIEFRKGSASLNAADALAWAELTLLFVHSAMQVAPNSLRTIPANIRGLRQFLGKGELKYLQPMFAGKNGEESLQPQLMLMREVEEEEILRTKLKDDAKLQQELAKRQQT